MAIERRFIEENVKNASLNEYLAGALQRAGYGGMDLKRSPLGTRIIVRIERPGLVIGRKGRNIKRLTDRVENDFGMENPQIEVEEIERPELNANIMASKIADSLVKGVNFRRAAYGALRRMMEAGARGVEIVISGKITGGRSRSVRFADGYLKKCGIPAIEQVYYGYAVAKKKVGVLGVNVKIMPPDAVLPDEIEFMESESEPSEKEEE
jgi:small subunit ribosomal protein S3